MLHVHMVHRQKNDKFLHYRANLDLSKISPVKKYSIYLPCSNMPYTVGYAAILPHYLFPVPCSSEVSESLNCSSSARCLTNQHTGGTFCLESCYMNNGGCSKDQICRSTLIDPGRTCNPLIEACYRTECMDFPSEYRVPGSRRGSKGNSYCS